MDHLTIAATIGDAFTTESNAGASVNLDDRHAFACRYAASIVAGLAHRMADDLRLIGDDRRQFLDLCYGERTK